MWPSWWFPDVSLSPWPLFSFKQRLNSCLLAVSSWSSQCHLEFTTSKTKLSTSVVKQASFLIFSFLKLPSFWTSGCKIESPYHIQSFHVLAIFPSNETPVIPIHLFAVSVVTLKKIPSLWECVVLLIILHFRYLWCLYIIYSISMRNRIWNSFLLRKLVPHGREDSNSKVYSQGFVLFLRWDLIGEQVKYRLCVEERRTNRNTNVLGNREGDWMKSKRLRWKKVKVSADVNKCIGMDVEICECPIVLVFFVMLEVGSALKAEGFLFYF